MLSVIVLSTTVALIVYLGVGWNRMDTHCSAIAPGSGTFDSVSFSWYWNPLGFTCAYTGGQRDGDTETSLWF